VSGVCVVVCACVLEGGEEGVVGCVCVAAGEGVMLPAPNASSVRA